MSVRLAGAVIHLEGRCLVEDAEALLLALQDAPAAAIEIGGATRIHLAVVQVLLAAGRVVTGAPGDAVISNHLLQSLTQISAPARDLGLDG